MPVSCGDRVVIPRVSNTRIAPPLAARRAILVTVSVALEVQCYVSGASSLMVVHHASNACSFVSALGFRRGDGGLRDRVEDAFALRDVLVVLLPLLVASEGLRELLVDQWNGEVQI